MLCADPLQRPDLFSAGLAWNLSFATHGSSCCLARSVRCSDLLMSSAQIGHSLFFVYVSSSLLDVFLIPLILISQLVFILIALPPHLLFPHSILILPSPMTIARSVSLDSYSSSRPYYLSSVYSSCSFLFFPPHIRLHLLHSSSILRNRPHFSSISAFLATQVPHLSLFSPTISCLLLSPHYLAQIHHFSWCLIASLCSHHQPFPDDFTTSAFRSPVLPFNLSRFILSTLSYTRSLLVYPLPHPSAYNLHSSRFFTSSSLSDGHSASSYIFVHVLQLHPRHSSSPSPHRTSSSSFVKGNFGCQMSLNPSTTSSSLAIFPLSRSLERRRSAPDRRSRVPPSV
ncbi:hypothetical protein WMY93_010331 [Mugilogobius chulae]|uniref:Uncharacterized protein n=1 Tax=Mugilogobius chulae TaxID=88201 RepID=A0AAW0PAR3_9GOBI